MQENGLINRKKNNFFANFKEIIKSKFDRKYILNEYSPDSLKRNKKLIVKTLEKNPKFLDYIPEDIIQQELASDLPENGFVCIAIKSGYYLNDGKFRNNINIISKYIELTNSLPDPYFLGENVWENEEFVAKYIELAKQKEYILSSVSPDVLKQSKDLVINYYKEILKEDNAFYKLETNCDNILSQEILKDSEFVKEYVNFLQSNKIDKEIILNSLTHNEKFVQAIKNEPKTIEILFNTLNPENLREFFDIFYSEEELKKFFELNQEFTGKLGKLSAIYERNSLAIDTMDARLLDKNIPVYKLQVYATDLSAQQKLLELSDFRFLIFQKISDLNLERTERWNRLDSKTLENLADGYYDELLEDLYKEACTGNKITTEEIETLANLFSSKITGTGPKGLQYIGIEPTIINSNNIFGITTKAELDVFDKIKETICDIVIENPRLEDNPDAKKFDKYLEYFKVLEPKERMKLAILEKNFNMNLQDGIMIASNFGENIESMQPNIEQDKDVIEQIKAIKNIVNCDDIEILQQVGALENYVQMDLNQGTMLFDEAKEMFERDIKKDLYSPREEDLKEIFDGVEIYKAPKEFEAITKFLEDFSAQDVKEVWESSLSNFDDKKNLRYKTCTSLTSGEIINPRFDGRVTIAFGQSAKEFSFGGFYVGDSHTNMSSDPVYWQLDEEGSQYMGKEDFISETDGRYNEIILNTFVKNSEGVNKKLMPEYIIYYQEKTGMTKEEREDDINWKNAIEYAKEFGIPIVTVDCEEIRKNQLEQIKQQAQAIKSNYDYTTLKRFVKKVSHYEDRYGSEEIQKIINQEQREEYQKYIDKHKPKEGFRIEKYQKRDLPNEIENNKKELEELGIGE